MSPLVIVNLAVFVGIMVFLAALIYLKIREIESDT